MQDIIIACAGTYGVELFNEITEINKKADRDNTPIPYRILGFLSDVKVDLSKRGIKADILGTVQDWIPKGEEKYVIGLSRPAQKKKVSDLLKRKGAKFENIVSVYSKVSQDIIMGEGCFITGGSFVSCGVRIGDFVNINGSMIYAGAQIGNYSTTTGFTVIEDARIGDGVFVGSKAVVINGCTVSDWANVSAGSVVTEDVRPGVTVFGMPAQEIG